MKWVMNFLTVVGFVLYVNASTSAHTIYVKSGATGDGSTWANAYGLLQDALDDADPDDEIWVASGKYKPTYDYGLNIGDRGKHFRMINRVAIYGGFPATGDPGIDDRDPNTHETILSGDIAGNDEPVADPLDLLDDPNRSENCFHIFYHPEGANLDPNAVLDGFAIYVGNANGSTWPHSVSGGMINFYSSPTVRNCTFSGNTGGGMVNFYSSPTVIHCTFTANTASDIEPFGWGGGIANFYLSSPIVKNCIFTGNYSIEFGGGISNYSNCSPTVTNCTFIGNSAPYGGGISNYINCSPTVTNCIFSDNSAQIRGGGVFNINSSPTVTGCIFTGNSTGEGGGICNTYGSSPTVTNCIFSGNSAYFGGGMRNRYNCSSTVTNCTFSDNSAQIEGGGMENCSESNPTLTNCTFSGNLADRGGGVSNHNTLIGVTLSNCILWCNTAYSEGHEIYNNSNSIPVISYCDIAGCGGSGAGWDISLGSDDDGNIDADPRFKDADGPDNILGTEDDNLQLAYNSPCIDAGDNTAVPLDTADLDGDGDTTERIPLDLAGHARFTDDPLTPDTGVSDPPDYPNVVDMGAYERYEFCGDPSQALKGDLNLDCYIDLLDFAIMTTYWLQYIGPE